MVIDEKFKLNNDNRFTGFCGIRIDEIAYDYVVGSVEIEEKHLNPFGTAHGGMIYTLMDVVGGSLAHWGHGKERKMVTLSSSISFLKPLGMGKATCRATFVKDGNTVSVVNVVVSNKDGIACSSGTFEFFYT